MAESPSTSTTTSTGTDTGAELITRRDKDKRWNRPTGQQHVFQIRGRIVYWLELEDVLFHHNSAVMMPDRLDGTDDQDQITGLDVIATGLTHARDNADQKLLVTGHTDTSGGEAYNVSLSEMRGDNALAVLVGERDTWASVAQGKHKVEDYQQILTWIASTKGWPCDPGGVDNNHGTNTTNAIIAFKDQYKNAPFGEDIGSSGTVDLATWKAFFTMYMERLKEILQTDDAGLGQLHGNLKWLNDAQRRVGCGEFHPVEQPGRDGFRSQANRRVELVFFDPGEEPRMDCHGGGTCQPDLCELYDGTTYDFHYITPTPGPTPATLEVVSPSKDRKQYVNLETDSAQEAQGRKVTLQAKVSPAKAGTTIHWAFEDHSKLVWAGDDKDALKPSGLGEALQAGFNSPGTKTAQSSTDDKGIAEIEFHLSEYGGDEYVVGAALTADEAKDKDKLPTNQKSAKLTVMRKVFQQMTHDDALKLPDLVNSRKAYERFSAELIDTAPKKLKKADAPDRTYYPHSMIEPGEGDEEVAVIGSHNKAFFQGHFVAEADKPVKAHLIICEHQWDEGDPTDKVDVNIDKSPSDEIEMSEAIFNPPLSGDLVITGTWKSGGKSGKLTDTNIILEKNRSGREFVKVELPSDAPTPTSSKKVKVSLKLRGASGPFLGESSQNGEPHMLIVFDKDDPRDFQNTVSHEIMHALNQTPEPTKQPDGLPDHPHQYTGHGGSGSHCNTVDDGSGNHVKGTEKTVGGEKVFTTGICAMFHAGDETCIDRFCDICEPYLRAQKMTEFV